MGRPNFLLHLWLCVCVYQDMSQANSTHGLGLLGVIAHVPLESTEVRDEECGSALIRMCFNWSLL